MALIRLPTLDSRGNGDTGVAPIEAYVDTSTGQILNRVRQGDSENGFTYAYQPTGQTWEFANKAGSNGQMIYGSQGYTAPTFQDQGDGSWNSMGSGGDTANGMHQIGDDPQLMQWLTSHGAAPQYDPNYGYVVSAKDWSTLGPEYRKSIYTGGDPMSDFLGAYGPLLVAGFGAGTVMGAGGGLGGIDSGWTNGFDLPMGDTGGLTSAFTQGPGVTPQVAGTFDSAPQSMFDRIANSPWNEAEGAVNPATGNLVPSGGYPMPYQPPISLNVGNNAAAPAATGSSMSQMLQKLGIIPQLADLLAGSSGTSGGLLGAGMSALPSYLAYNYANNLPQPNIGAYTDLYNKAGDTSGLLGTYDLNTGTGRSQLQNSLSSRGVLGSSFGDQALTNYNTQRDLGRGSLGYQGIGTQLNALNGGNTTLLAQNKIKTDLLGRALGGAGNALSTSTTPTGGTNLNDWLTGFKNIFAS
ncbi:hypothetical protein [Caudoviricetes sp.]|nr:hypothetical protein [Caudoviricetes sp.]